MRSAVAAPTQVFRIRVISPQDGQSLVVAYGVFTRNDVRATRSGYFGENILVFQKGSL